MNLYYSDILSLINKEPVFFDEYAVPRFCEFSPQNVANIYAIQVALVHIKCQFCHKDFNVAFSSDTMTEIRGGHDLKTRIKNGSLHYGDPPNMQCCAGTTANCLDLQVLEFWEQVNFEWIRNEEFEDYLPDFMDVGNFN